MRQEIASSSQRKQVISQLILLSAWRQQNRQVEAEGDQALKEQKGSNRKETLKLRQSSSYVCPCHSFQSIHQQLINLPLIANIR